MLNSETFLGPSTSIETGGYAYRTNKEFKFYKNRQFLKRRFFKTLLSVFYQPFENGFCHVWLHWRRLDKTKFDYWYMWFVL